MGIHAGQAARTARAEKRQHGECRETTAQIAVKIARLDARW
jgi:hypothetical protein